MPAALAIAAHPDDIEFLMAGTLLLLGEAGWQLHYFNVSNGDLGSLSLPRARIAAQRKREAQAAAKMLGARWHAPVGSDLQIFYDDRTLRRVTAAVRAAAPRVLLTHSPQDYMEDHTNACRLAVTAAFARGVPNFRTQPARRAVAGPVTVYHALPHGLRDGLRRRIAPELFVDTAPVHARKREALACHASQNAWLDATQGMGSYLAAMDEFSREVGRMSGKFAHAEGWRRHSHLGFCSEEDDPLHEALGVKVRRNGRYLRALEDGA
jgi:N-acetylglucosamine malate deacetylase 1